MSVLRSPGYGWAFARPVHRVRLASGMLAFRGRHRTPWLSYWSMWRLYCTAREKSNQWLHQRLAEYPGAEPRVPGLLGAPTASLHERAIGELRIVGFSVLGRLPDDACCDRLVSLAQEMPGYAFGSRAGVGSIRFDVERPQTVRLDLPEDALVEDLGVQQLLADPTPRSLARDYLGCEPVNDLVPTWWCAPGTVSSKAARLYHFDMDRPRFLKLIFYLPDFDASTGPHFYLRASHRERPSPLWRDGRHAKAAVLAACNPEREAEITAPRGSVTGIDTSALREGKQLKHGHRLILQIEYTSALFGALTTA